MPKHYAILSSQVTSSMRSLSEHEATLTYFQVSDANETAMDTIVNAINDDFWLKTGTVIWEDGSVSQIVVPKEAMKK